MRACRHVDHKESTFESRPCCIIAGQFQNEFPELVGLTDYSIDSVQEGPNRSITVEVLVSKGSQEVTLRFLLLRKDVGRKKGALMTKSLTRL